MSTAIEQQSNRGLYAGIKNVAGRDIEKLKSYDHGKIIFHGLMTDETRRSREWNCILDEKN